MRLRIIIIFILLFQVCLLSAQRNNFKDPKPMFEAGKKFFSDIYILPDTSSDSVVICVLYKVSNQTLTFIKKSENGIENYLTVPNFEVELKDSEGIIRKRIFSEDSIEVTDYEVSVSSNDYIYGFVSTKMKAGKYTLNAYLRCANSQLLKNKIFPLIEFKNFQKDKIISEPIITSPFEPDKGITVKPYIMGIGIPFSSEGASILIPVSYESEFEKFKYTLKYTKPREKYFDWGGGLNLSGALVPLKNCSILRPIIIS